MHDPVHVPALHTYGHVAPVFCQAPVALHVSGCWPLHSWVPGVHEPLHAPLTHAWLAQGEPLFCHVPAALHVCGCCPLHWVAPGVPEPPHAPSTHA